MLAYCQASVALQAALAAWPEPDEAGAVPDFAAPYARAARRATETILDVWPRLCGQAPDRELWGDDE
jgi:hypothetical protein